MNIGHFLCEIASRIDTERATAEAAKVQKADYSKYNQTERVIALMLTENCGTHILDSGGSSGRNWQRNQGRDFKSEPASTIKFHAGSYNEISVTHNIFHWLTERCTYDRAMTKAFLKFAEANSGSYLGLADDFPKHLSDQGKDISGGDYGRHPFTENTYNCENNLSQDMQFTVFSCGDTNYAIISIHGGADIRGGYSTPRVFEVDDNFFDYAHAHITPDFQEVKAINQEIAKYHEANPALPGVDVGPDEIEGGNVYWQTDDAYHWYFEGTCGRDYNDKQLEKMPFEAIESREEWRKGTVGVLPDGTGLCPYTGCKLQAYF